MIEFESDSLHGFVTTAAFIHHVLSKAWFVIVLPVYFLII